MKRFYIATKVEHREHAEAAANVLRDEGFEVSSRWHAEDGEVNNRPNKTDVRYPDYAKTWADNDLYDVSTSDAVVILVDQETIHKAIGTHVEMGYALALDKPVFMVGQMGIYPSIFHYLSQVFWVSDLATLRIYLRGFTDGQKA